MAKKRRPPPAGHINSEGWMVSYADMATILLAMFIVLSTLGKDQTGVNLYNGTGSFKHALDCFGLPGLFGDSSQPLQFEAPNPHYLTNPQPGQASPDGAGPDGGQDPERVIDIEQEQMQHFLRELDRHFHVEKLPRTAGQAVVDFYDRLNPSPPYLTAKQGEVIWQVVPVLARPDFRVQLIVWATTPSESAWVRAANQARLIADEVAEAAQLDPAARRRLVPLGQPWPYRDLRRPILSVVIGKLEPAR